VDETFDTDVVAVLLSYGRLNSSQRKAFADRLNDFVYDSPQRQRGMMAEWSKLCEHPESAELKMVAESSPAYCIGRKKRRKPKSGK
jgi:hypothetical protein